MSGYIVTVVDRSTSECIDERTFAFGTWDEIGLWLDHYGYNTSRYRLNVHFTD